MKGTAAPERPIERGGRGEARRDAAAWPRVPLGELCRQDRQIVEPGSREASDLPYLSLEHVESQTGRILKQTETPVEDEGKSTTFRFDRGHVLYGKLRPYLNKVAMPDFAGRCTTEMIPLLPAGGVDRAFLAWVLRREETIAWALRQNTGSRMPRADMDSLLTLEIPLPPLAEQERIAGWVSRGMERASVARRAALDRLAAAEALPAALLREVFGPVAPFSASPMVPVEGTRPGWRWHLLTNIARLATGHTPSRREPTWWGGDIQWLQLPDIRAVDGRRVTKTIEQTNALGIANSSSVLLPAGTVCMSRTASVGFVTIMGREMATSQDFVNWVCGPDLDPDFLMYLILRCRREIRELGSGATHHSIYFETVENFSVCVPSVADQRRIAADLAARLGGAGRLAEGIRAELAAIDALPGALLREAFGGSEVHE